MIGLVTTSYPRTPDDWAGAFVRERARVLARTDEVEIVAAGSSEISSRGTPPPSLPRRYAPGEEPGPPPPTVRGRGRTGGGVPHQEMADIADSADSADIVRIPSPLFAGAGAPEALEAGGVRAVLEGLVFTARLARTVAERAPRWAAVESHWLVPCAFVTCAVAGGRPHRAFSHGGDVALLERLPGGDALARAIARSGASFVFASADLRDRFFRLCGGPVPAVVEPAPFDEALFSRRTPDEQARLRQRLSDGRSIVLGVGRLVPVKGFDVLVRALARMPRDRRPRLVLLGEGPERSALLERAARAGVDAHLPGAVGRAAVADWMSAAILYVQPSVELATGRAEGMPVAVREALAIGVPVIASAVGGLRELSGALTLVPPGDADALARAIASFL
jgi:hypothetical protein